jgi:hypothetical protein
VQADHAAVIESSTFAFTGTISPVPMVPVPLLADWQELADLATVLGVGVALFVGISTTIVMIRQEKVTRDGHELQRELSKVSAERAEAAARLTEEYTQRVVDALEAIARQGTRAEPHRLTPVRWSLVNHNRSRYLLTNEGEVEASNVRVSAHKSLSLLNLPDTPRDISPHEAISFLAAPSLGTKDFTITVQWTDSQSGEEKSWKYPLPLQG